MPNLLWREKNTKIKGYVFVIAAAILIAAMPTIGKPLILSINPVMLTAMIFSVAAASTAPFSRILKPNLLLLSIAVCGASGPLLLYYGLVFTSAAHYVIFSNFETVFTVIFALSIFREKLAKRGMVGIAVIIFGIFAAAMITNNINDTKNSIQGDLLISVAGVLLALDNNLSNKAIKAGYDPLPLTTTKFLFSALLLLPLIIGYHIPIPTISPTIFLGILYSGAFGFGLGYILQYKALKVIGVLHTIMILTVVANLPALIFASVFLHENISTTVALALALIFIGVYLLESRK